MGYGQYSSNYRPSLPDFPAKTDKLKHVFGKHGESDVEHVWANPLQKDGSGFAQEWGTNPGKNFYFRTHADARVLYSYRDDYPVANLFYIGRRPIYLLRSGEPWSVTTAQHMSAARNAVPDRATKFYVKEVSSFYSRIPDKSVHKENVADYIERIEINIEKHNKARSSWEINSRHSVAQSLLKEVRAYARLFKIKLPKLPRLPKLDKHRLDAAKAREASREARQKAASDAKYAAYREARAKYLPRWRAGENVNFGTSSGENALLRLIQDESGRYFVNTSMSVSVPVTGHAGAARLLKFLRATREAGRTYKRNGHTEHIGNFTVDSFDGETLIAGCHTIAWSEIEAIADAVVKAAEAEDLDAKVKRGWLIDTEGDQIQ